MGEVDRLMAVAELRESRPSGRSEGRALWRGYGELLRIPGAAMATSAQTDLLTGPIFYEEHFEFESGARPPSISK